MIQLKRVYDESGPHDGLCFLVERLWPRGIRKADLRTDGGKRKPARVLNCENGLVTTRKNGGPSSGVFRGTRYASGGLGADRKGRRARHGHAALQFA